MLHARFCLWACRGLYSAGPLPLVAVPFLVLSAQELGLSVGLPHFYAGSASGLLFAKPDNSPSLRQSTWCVFRPAHLLDGLVFNRLLSSSASRVSLRFTHPFGVAARHLQPAPGRVFHPLEPRAIIAHVKEKSAKG